VTIKTIIGLVGILLIIVPLIQPFAEGFSLYYQLLGKEITSSEYQNKIVPIIVDILTPGEKYIVDNYSKYGFWVVGILLMIYWIFTGEANKIGTNRR